MLTVNRTDKWHPRFSPDGSKISFGAEPNIYVMPVTSGADVCNDIVALKTQRLLSFSHGHVVLNRTN